MKTKIYMLVLLVGVGLIVGSLAYKNEGDVEKSSDAADQTKTETGDKTAQGGNSLEGLLQASDDAKLGNFKLVSGSHEIYIRTARDFTKLLGMQVVVMINGTLDNFQLLDMQPAVEKDGFIISH